MNTILIMTKNKFSFTKLITQYLIIILFEKFSTSMTKPWRNVFYCRNSKVVMTKTQTRKSGLEPAS